MSPPETQRRARHRPAADSIIESLSNDKAECSQLTLSVSPGVRLGDPETSRQAAELAPEYRSRLRERILNLLRQGRATDDEIVQQLPEEHPGSVSKRRHDLVRAGLVVDTGRRRPTRRGTQAIVWAAVDEAPRYTLQQIAEHLRQADGGQSPEGSTP
jgi:hypothetical protein